jgi:hypothetical protein
MVSIQAVFLAGRGHIAVKLREAGTVSSSARVAQARLARVRRFEMN